VNSKKVPAAFWGEWIDLRMKTENTKRIIYYSAENEPSRNKTSSNSTRDHTVQTVILTDGTVDFPNNRIFTPLHLPFGLKTEAISSLILRSHRCARPGHGGYSTDLPPPK
jgi:hypothetical protein